MTSSSNTYYAAQINTNSSHKSHKHGKESGSKGPSVSKTSSSSSKGKSTAPDVSFLFCVNEWKINFELNHEERDQWLNSIPPTSQAAYVKEYKGTVFRYRSGIVTVAQGYEWVREAPGYEGRITFYDPASNYTWVPEPYKTESVFACSAHLPIITLNGDASLGSLLSTNCRDGCDRQSLNPDDDDDQERYTWRMPHFTDRDNGVSVINSTRTGVPFVSGKNPSWIPSLVPKVFENTYRHENRRSKGLAGDLPVIIGLMSFHSSRPKHGPDGSTLRGANEVFMSQMWHRNRWEGPRDAPVRGYPETPEDNPRGFVIQVSPDFSSEDMATINTDYNYLEPIRDGLYQSLEDLENFGILVEG
ncbi:hypothetical protein B0T16DRAFT_462363 [Cercophora newfieldiana]|uniref:Uncharacterized protein n=1 Tax=Cercophora newfieldiana TaxID=92897 RepID=A0AA40CIN4_9PEZI|nr:hypothetical protein B0T16DRAFT_462363 [Cercophora newfieldiana]